MSLRACAPVFLGFDDPLVAELCPARELCDDVPRGCLEEVKAGFVGANEQRAQIPDPVALGAHRCGGGTRAIFEIGDVPAGDVRLDQIHGHALDASPASAEAKWRNP